MEINEDEFEEEFIDAMGHGEPPIVQRAHLYFKAIAPEPKNGIVTLEACPQAIFKIVGVHVSTDLDHIELVSIEKGKTYLWPEANGVSMPFRALMGLTFDFPSVTVGEKVSVSVHVPPGSGAVPDLFITLIGKAVR
jgi:hypothetical protein